MTKPAERRSLSQVIAWSIVVAAAAAIYFIIQWGQSALGLDSLFYEKLAIGDEKGSWVWTLVLFPFVIGLALFLFSTVMGRSAKLVTLFGAGISYAALTGQIVLSMSGVYLLIFPLLLPLQPLERWLGLDNAGYLPFRGTPAQDTVIPALLAFGIALTIVGLVQIVIAMKKERLATQGLYATMRHPQHLGIMIWALGFALWGSFYLDFVIWFTLVYVLVLLAWYEEGKLKKRFGTDYKAYQQNTPFMIPFLPKKGAFPKIRSGKDWAILIGIYPAGLAAIFCVFYFFSVSWW